MNGVQIYNGTTLLEGILNDIHGLNVSYLGLSEINLALDKPELMAAVKESVKECLGRDATVYASTTKTKVKHKYKPGGTAVILRSIIVGRIEPRGRGGG